MGLRLWAFQRLALVTTPMISRPLRSGPRADVDSLSDRVLIREKALGKTFADDGDARGGGGIAPIELTTCEHGHAHDTEEARTDDVFDSLQGSCRGRRQGHGFLELDASGGTEIRVADGFDAGELRETVGEIVKISGAIGDFLVTGLGEEIRRRAHLRGGIPDRRSVIFEGCAQTEAAPMTSTSERATCAVTSNLPKGPALPRTLREVLCKAARGMGMDDAPGRSKTEDERSEDGYGGGECQHARAERSDRGRWKCIQSTWFDKQVAGPERNDQAERGSGDGEHHTFGKELAGELPSAGA